MRKLLLVLVALGALGGSKVRAGEAVRLRLLGSPIGDQAPILINNDPAHVLSGTFIVQDKSKGVTWFLNLAKGTARAVELPFNNGNHESALTADGLTLASPHYETLGPGDFEGGGFFAGSEVSLVDVKTGRSSVLTGSANPVGRPKPHGASWLANGDLIITAQLANSLIRFAKPLNADGGGARVYSFMGSSCHTPHLVQ